MTVAGRVAEAYLHHRADAVMVDGGGVGGGVVDRLRQLKIPVIEVQFGAKSDLNDGHSETGIKYKNKRSEIWGSMKEWLKVGMIVDLTQLSDELQAPQYGFSGQGQDELLLESKDSMRKRGAASPDIADALALTFAYPVAPRMTGVGPEPDYLVKTEYDPFDEKVLAA